MDTKLKKYKAYSKGAKITAVFFIFILVTVITLCSLGIVWVSGGTSDRFEGLVSMDFDKYTETGAFRNKFDEVCDEAILVNLVYKSEGNIRDGKAVDQNDLIEEFKDYYNIIDGVITSNTTISDDYTVTVTGEIPEDLIVNYNEYENLVETKLRDYRNIYIQNQLNDYIDKKVDLDKYVNYFYSIETKDGSYVAGNASVDYITALEQHMVLEGEFLSDKMDAYSGYKNEAIASGNYVFYAGIADTFKEGDIFYENNQDFYLRKQIYPVMISTMLFSGLIIIILVIYLLRTAGQSEPGGEVTKIAVDRIYNDIHTLLAGGFLLISAGIILFVFAVILGRQTEAWLLSAGAGLIILINIDTAVGLSYLCSLSRHFKSKTVLYNTFVAAVFRKIGAVLNGKSFSGWMATLFIGYSVIICLLSAIICQDTFQSAYLGYHSSFTGIFIVILLFLMISAAIIVIRSAISLSIIMKSAKKGAQGQFDEANINMKKITPVFTDFAQDINDMQKGLKVAVEEAVKGERMKTDLITNVSHDLKTLLTSIITYADLLDKEKLDNERAEGYVDVLVEKSVRLKHLIEDLIEASKVSSGNISVEKTKINYKQLAVQACCEYEEKFENMNLELRLNGEDDVFIYADGQHMWRIMDNLLSNVFKYAMNNTRVYVDIFKEGKDGVLIVKNTSKHEIDYNIKNLTERFFRGDSSRSTEGSGLGLSIANSLTEVQKGDFEIEADGDLFKVIVKMPLWNNIEGHNESTN